MTSQATSFQDLVQGGITTVTYVIKKETRDVYASYFKKFCDFCISNEYPDPATARHYELPLLLVTFMESVSASVSVSNKIVKKIRAAEANFYGSYERRNEAGPDKWIVIADDQGIKYELGNLSKDAFVRQFMRGLKKRKSTELTHRLWFLTVAAFAFYGMCRINEVLSFRWKDLTLSLTRPSAADPSVSITYGVYKLEGRKTDVAEAKTDYEWSDNDYIFPALSKISKMG
ncbi:uncharacterized protein PITG_07067 [Phytophthora infestans T30-4]|uniref:Uncharacterized protein n=1 Tax=Phytophthora infestans (strain T30-4) TaxID=403677 RepID=D0N766_PHYIT|nr:uncharacterized protein PITG_07067 [Phytophthora infestans T30-4]EEY53415.1 conserved hypothetical protein [Phytophthora infestans T30-4]|eukprot:XP_002905033.1 conserved hypothetical protein [Phytophthora infestans T30-4]